MIGQKTAQMAAILAAIIAFGVGTAVLKGGLFLNMHEGDVIQLADMVLRMAEGQIPHLDFMTPIGALSLAPAALFVSWGAGVGHGLIYGQLLAAVVLMPAVLWAARSRLPGPIGMAFAIYVTVLVVALIHGETEQAVSFSMHYNRWAWAIFYVVFILAVLPAQARARPGVDGVIIGVGMACLALIKVTYFVAFAVPITLALVLRGQGRAVVVAGVAGLGVALLATLAWGPAFWLAYLGDLQLVAQSSARPAPGLPLIDVVIAPKLIGASAVLLAAVILLRKSGVALGGLILLLAAPGMVYVTYQNFGNDPQWLVLVALVLLALMPDADRLTASGQPLRLMVQVCAVAALSLGFPSAFNLALSPLRNFNQDYAKMIPLLYAGGKHEDLQSFSLRMSRNDARIPLDTVGGPFAAWAERAEREEPAVLNGEALPDCESDLGLKSWFTTVAGDLSSAGYEGAGIFGADLFSPYWLYGPFRPVRGAAPWYYDGLSGLDDADYVLVPLCPMSQEVRARILEDIAAQSIQLEEVRRTDIYILLKRKTS